MAARTKKIERKGNEKTEPLPRQDSFVKHEEVARKAYELFKKHGCMQGNDLEDWYEAERLTQRKKRRTK